MPDPDLGIREGGGVGKGEGWGRGGWGSTIRGEAFRASVWSKNKGGGGARGSSPASATAFQKKTAST